MRGTVLHRFRHAAIGRGLRPERLRGGTSGQPKTPMVAIAANLRLTSRQRQMIVLRSGDYRSQLSQRDLESARAA